jgi:hypothetical protein
MRCNRRPAKLLHLDDLHVLEELRRVRQNVRQEVPDIRIQDEVLGAHEALKQLEELTARIVSDGLQIDGCVGQRTRLVEAWGHDRLSSY